MIIDGTLIVSEGTTEIKDEEYAFCEDLIEVVLPTTIKRIGKSAFQECVNLGKINFPTSIEEIDDAAFCNCLSLVKPNLSDKVKVGALAFHHTKRSIT